MSVGTVLGTPGYFPMAKVWRDGSKKWDIWALAAIILEADMNIDVYLPTQDEKQALQLFHQHCYHPDTCKHLKSFLTEIFNAKRTDDLLSLEDMKTQLQHIKFRNNY